MPPDGPRQDPSLDVCAGPCEVCWGIRVIDPVDGLLNDRALVQISRNVVGGGADELDAALVGLVVWFCALERREELVEYKKEGRVSTCKLPLLLVIFKLTEWWMLMIRPDMSEHSLGERICMYLARTTRSILYSLHSRRISSSCHAFVLLPVFSMGRWKKGIPCAFASASYSSWLLTISGTSIGSVPLETRKSKSLRQCPILLTMIIVRGFSSSRWISKLISISAPSSAVKSAWSVLERAALAVLASACTRIKKRFVVGSPNWAESRILKPRWARKPVTRCTMPWRSGHESVKMKLLRLDDGNGAAAAADDDAAPPWPALPASSTWPGRAGGAVFWGVEDMLSSSARDRSVRAPEGAGAESDLIKERRDEKLRYDGANADDPWR